MEPLRGERAGGALDELLQRAAWAGGENFKTGLERKQRKTEGLKPEHQDTPRLVPLPELVAEGNERSR